MNIYLTVDGIAGSSVEDAAEEMQVLANKLSVNVQMKFNDTLLVANPDGIATNLVTAYYEQISSKTPYRIAFSRQP